MTGQQAGIPTGAGASVTRGIPRVNLMPRAEIERRRRTALVRAWGWGLVGALAVVLAAGAAAFTANLAAQQALAAEQARTTALLTELQALSEVGSALADTTALEAFRAEAMAGHVAWEGELTAIAAALPAGTTVTGFDLTALPGTPAADAAGADAAQAAAVTGTLTLQSASPVDVAEAIRAVRSVPGVLAADGRDVSSGATDGPRLYTSVLGIELDQSVYTGSFAPAGTPEEGR
ncbi:hypothetical protein ACIGCK_10165 [Microbacterium sp. NPDC078428]|uniref:hypothetical protein n=1 Tax=Microbacterium sp. NPDC078428 TaxID=3364190 RepID=UPI0037C60987